MSEEKKENKIVVKVLYELTEEGRKENLLAGRSGNQSQSFELVVTDSKDQKKILNFANVNQQGEITVRLSPWINAKIYHDSPIVSLSDVLGAIDRLNTMKELDIQKLRQQQMEEEECKKERQEVITNFEALVEEKKTIISSWGFDLYLIDGSSFPCNDHNNKKKAIEILRNVDEREILRNVIEKQKEEIAALEARSDKTEEEIVTNLWKNEKTITIEYPHDIVLSVKAESEDEDEGGY